MAEKKATATLGARRCQLSVVVTQACGCVVDFGVIADGMASGSAPMHLFQARLPGKPRYLNKCQNDPRHVSLAERARMVAAMQRNLSH